MVVRLKRDDLSSAPGIARRTKNPIWKKQASDLSATACRKAFVHSAFGNEAARL